MRQGDLRRSPAGLLDDLSGTPEVIASQAVLSERIGSDLHQLSGLLRECLAQDMRRRDRLDVRSYLERV